VSKYIADTIKVVFFDHDDTLVGTIGPKWRQHKHVARTFYDKELTDDEIKEHWGRPLTELMCLLYGTDDIDQAMVHTKATHENFPKELFTATVPALHHLKAEGKLTGIITATTHFSLDHDLALHEIPKSLLDYIQTSDDTPYHKPDSRVFEPALAWLTDRNIRPDEVLYVGDSLYDLQAAAGAGFNFLGVETGLVTAGEFKDKNVKSIPGIGELIDGLSS